MSKPLDITKIELSPFVPSWINPLFPNDEEYIQIKEVVLFYLNNSPCARMSSRSCNISGWGNPHIILLEKLKSLLGLEKGNNYDYGKSKYEMKELFIKYDLGTDFTSSKNNMVIFLYETNAFESFLKHIRNAIAHSRWQLIGDICYFEDGSDETINGTTYFCVTARIVLNISDLKELRTLIINGPSESDLLIINQEQILLTLLDRLRARFNNNPFTRKDAIKYLEISNETWKKLYKKGKLTGILRFKNSHWHVIP